MSFQHWMGEVMGERKAEFYKSSTFIRENKGYLFLKRTLDMLGSCIGILICLPVIIILIFLIKSEDGGPIIFKQMRVGKKGKKFVIYKFRSMSNDAEEIKANLMDLNEIEGAMFKMKEDPRVTRIGKFIRKTSLDEIPQFYNVIIGDMSLVGPRPPLIEEVELYSDYDMQRLSVTPGISGLWQISGRSNLSFSEMVDLDLEYVRNRNTVMDIKIILKTIWHIVDVRRNGAF